MLSERAVRQAKAKGKAYKLSDSEGLYLFVVKSGPPLRGRIRASQNGRKTLS